MSEGRFGGKRVPTERMLAFDKIHRERLRQDDKWGEQNHDDLTWYAIFGEEAGEIGKACIPLGVGGANAHDDKELEKEVVQAAAVLVSWLEARARRKQVQAWLDVQERRL